MHRLQTGADKFLGGGTRNAFEYILHLNEVVSIVNTEKDQDKSVHF